MKSTFKLVLILSGFFLVFGQSILAQDCRLTGVVLDQSDSKALPYAYVVVTGVQDTTDKHFAATDINGKFTIYGLKRSLYKVDVTFISYKTTRQSVLIKDQFTDLGNLFLIAQAKRLETVNIVANVPQAIQKGDTTEFNADAFKVNKDATTEDLVKKMPGVTIDNSGTVTAKGEQVQKVLVDGKPMFGDDPTIALRNLPAEIVDKIQVFDKLSDQSELTGFDDGNTTHTMNIITRTNKRNGQFGKISLGYGDQDKYIAAGSINFFNGNRRISIIGLSNNTNQQNFSMQDILGVVGQNGRMRGGYGGGGRGGFQQSGGLNNFLIGQQNGISTTNSFGINYSNQWGSKLELTASYFFNKSTNTTILNTNRQYLLSADSSQFYNETSGSVSSNYNHRFSMRLTYTIDSANTLLFVPSLNFQANRSSTNLSGINSASDIFPPILLDELNQSENINASHSNGNNLSGSLIFRHRFTKRGRTISLSLNGGINTKDITSVLLANNDYFKGKVGSDSLNQQASTANDGYNLSSNITYTEPMGKTGQLALSMNNSYTSSKSDKGTYNYDYLNEQYAFLDTLLTNKYDYGYQTNRAGISYRFRKDKTSFTLGTDFQNSNLDGSQVFPNDFTISKNFNNVLPNAMFRYRASDKINLQIVYRTATNSPSISQLQSVIDNSNPLLLTTGNPKLVPQYTHTLFTRFSFTNPEKSTNFFAFMSGGYTVNNIGNATIIARKDTLLPGGVLLRQGSQLSKPLNFGTVKSLRSFFVYGFPVKPIKCNLNFNTGLTWSESPGYINQLLNTSNSYGITQGVVLSSNISEKVDFLGSYGANYNIVSNSVRPDLNDNYLIQNYGFKTNIVLADGLTYETDFSGNKYTGLSSKFNQTVFLWNMGLGYKFLKSKNAELRLNVNNILNKNNSIVRNITQTYIEDQKANTLGRFFMLVFTYNLRNFNGAQPPAEGPPGGFRYGGPGGFNRFRPN